MISTHSNGRYQFQCYIFIIYLTVNEYRYSVYPTLIGDSPVSIMKILYNLTSYIFAIR